MTSSTTARRSDGTHARRLMSGLVGAVVLFGLLLGAVEADHTLTASPSGSTFVADEGARGGPHRADSECDAVQTDGRPGVEASGALLGFGVGTRCADGAPPATSTAALGAPVGLRAPPGR